MTEVLPDQVSVLPDRRPMREVAWFVVAAYLGSWVVGGLGYVVFDLGEVGLGAGVLMVAVAALTLTRRVQGSVRPLIDQIVRWRIAPRWYAAAVGVPFVAVGGALVVAPVLGGQGLGPDPAGWATLLTLPLYVLLLGGPEELGWRGYALPRLQSRLTALSASLVIGVIWVGWHVPLFLVANPLFDAIPLGPYAVIGVASSVVYTWLYNSTRGSILLAMVLHGSTNLALVWIGASTITWWVLAGAWVSFAVALLAILGRRDLARVPRWQH